MCRIDIRFKHLYVSCFCIAQQNINEWAWLFIWQSLFCHIQNHWRKFVSWHIPQKSINNPHEELLSSVVVHSRGCSLEYTHSIKHWFSCICDQICSKDPSLVIFFLCNTIWKTYIFPTGACCLEQTTPKDRDRSTTASSLSSVIEIHYLFIRNPLRLIQGKRTVESAVFRYHAKSARAADQLFTVRQRGHICVSECAAAAENNSTDISSTTSHTSTPSE